MPRTFDQILAEARELPAEQRERLVDELAADLDQAELSPEWSQEIRRRIRRLESGEAHTRDAHQVVDELLHKFGYWWREHGWMRMPKRSFAKHQPTMSKSSPASDATSYSSFVPSSAE
ncbi:MAG: addiction module protein [Myxococcota bacterium]